MKAIILAQSIIILLGAYYIYTLSNSVAVMPETPMVDMMPVAPTEREGYTPPTENPPASETSADSVASTTIHGPNDAGMEYPIMEMESR